MCPDYENKSNGTRVILIYQIIHLPELLMRNKAWAFVSDYARLKIVLIMVESILIQT